MLAGKTDRSNPSVHAVEGDERIRTAVPAPSDDDAYVDRSVAALIGENRRLIAEIRARRPEQERKARHAREGLRQAVAMLREASR